MNDEERLGAAGRLFALAVSLGEYAAAEEVLKKFWED